MNHSLHGHGHEEALWHCPHCQSWWCSQPVVGSTRFLLEIPVEMLNSLGWENFRGWRLGGMPHVSTCPECGNVMKQPRFGNAAAGAPLQVDLAEMLAPILAPAG